ncbi:hypothetical protein A3F02_01450 [Candidatus Curtissbacteria bacterium RIFCSPHIGHO2_12_FULL_38_9b]|uniref:Glycosyltransferase n=1 Tax=Candidatus Curtissbacteria bacterium RIFCSPHIGHO2_12_FULL_38_9b TaxID=1797720 RepID=A0A1F5H0C1_9BACT|nr:MAG: hypothetical protein A3F02_01450 [Candidatus Curtissbacteria bacterium RIFCSPHIGHO2_12_FULL_38_9b]
MAFKRLKKLQDIPRVDICGVEVDDISQKEAINRILVLTQDTKGGHMVVTVNSEFVMLARRNRQFADILKEADLALADGIGVVLSKLIFGGKVHQRITGVDLIEGLCAENEKKSIRVGFLGGFEDVAELVAKRQKKVNPRLKIVFAYPGDPTIRFDLKLKKIILQAGRIDILFVAYGMGVQEFWIKRFINKVNVGVFIGVGGAFDYIAAVKKRAPMFMQNTGFEWFWRLINEPARIWRMRVLPAFFLLVLKNRFFSYLKRS